MYVYIYINMYVTYIYIYINNAYIYIDSMIWLIIHFRTPKISESSKHGSKSPQNHSELQLVTLVPVLFLATT